MYISKRIQFGLIRKYYDPSQEPILTALAVEDVHHYVTDPEWCVLPDVHEIQVHVPDVLPEFKAPEVPVKPKSDYDPDDIPF